MNTDQIMDSREISDRIDELQDTDINEVLSDEDHSELQLLRALQEAFQNYGDWDHGDSVIPEACFVEYISDIIDECYEIKKSSDWPYRHMTLDYEAAADEAKQDYTTCDHEGETYYFRA